MGKSNSKKSGTNYKYLETEKENFIKVMIHFIDGLNFEEEQHNGRPRIDLNEILKSLLSMIYHSWSYRRAKTDFKEIYEKELLQHVPSRATLNRHMRDPEFKKILENLIQLSALSFVGVEDCGIMDSTWFSNMIKLSSNYRKNKRRNFDLPSLSKTRKVHVIIGRDSKIIICARTSVGSVHDSVFFKDLLDTSVKLGFKFKTLLCDAAYNSKENYILAEEYGIQAFLDFKRNHVLKRSKSWLRKQQLILYRNDPETWHQFYDYRSIVEVVFSSVKRKSNNYLRGRQDVSQDCEMLLKILCYNLCIIAKHYSF